ncbi:MAG: 16S rRNA (guanine(527)-N(7))-methyltransferase RsmG [Deltaproteobacteria bacterium]|nr:16S rRNA (guanine(527)-N(7))-methyltransferase RsmG [Deltaproteobacteria bacterium]
MKKSQKLKVRNQKEKTKELLKIGAEELGIPLGDAEISLFLKYLEELKEWNKKINLTAIKDDKGIIIRHFLDSLTLTNFLKSCKTLLDIGSGAGFPGIPLKIVIPELKVTLLDSDSRKVSFMRHIIRTLGLKDISAIQGRAEDKKVADELSIFDVVAARAFSGLKVFLYTAKKYVKEGGIILAVKGPKGVTELEELGRTIGITFTEKGESRLPFSDITTSILVFKRMEQ